MTRVSRILVVALLPTLGGCPAAPAEGAPEPDSNAKIAEAEAPAAAPRTGVAQAAGADHADCIYAPGEHEVGDPACPGGAGEEPDAPAGGDGHFGAPFTLAQTVPLHDAVAGKTEGPVFVAGEVEAVCQAKGCWMVLKDGELTARVLMKEHGFAVPTDARGKHARVEGVLSSRTFSEAQVKHIEKDRGGDPAAVAGERTEHVLTASAIEIKS